MPGCLEAQAGVAQLYMNTCSYVIVLMSSRKPNMTTVTQMKCACEQCLCVVDTSSAVEKSGKYYCSQACADGHQNGEKGCGHTGCGCA